VRPQPAHRGQPVFAAHLTDAEQIAEVGGLAVSVLALQGAARRFEASRTHRIDPPIGAEGRPSAVSDERNKPHDFSACPGTRLGAN
jgi:hypothetical protein